MASKNEIVMASYLEGATIAKRVYKQISNDEWDTVSQLVLKLSSARGLYPSTLQNVLQNKAIRHRQPRTL